MFKYLNTLRIGSLKLLGMAYNPNNDTLIVRNAEEVFVFDLNKQVKSSYVKLYDNGHSFGGGFKRKHTIALTFSDRSNRVAVLGTDLGEGEIIIMDQNLERIRSIPTGRNNSYKSLCFNSSGNELVCGGIGYFIIYTKDGHVRDLYKSYQIEGRICKAVYDSEGDVIFATENTLGCYNPQKAKLLAVTHGSFITRVGKFAPLKIVLLGNRILKLEDDSFRLCAFNFNTTKEMNHDAKIIPCGRIESYHDYRDAVVNVAGSKVALCGSSGLGVYDLTTNSICYELNCNKSYNAICLDPASMYLYAAYENGCIDVFETAFEFFKPS